jgi:hypothetical protein
VAAQFADTVIRDLVVEMLLSIDRFVARKRLGPSLADIWKRFLGRSRAHKYILAAFLTPLLIRATPEVLAGPYPVGYDTIASYVPLMLDWGSGSFRGFNPFVGGWLIFAILGLTYTVTRVDPVLIAKIAAPVLYGLLGLAEFFFSRRVLVWNQKMSALFVAVASIYFVSLRISFDLFRNAFGIFGLLVALGVGQNIKTWRNAATFAFLAWLVTITHLLVGTVLIGIIILETVFSNAGTRKLTFLIPAMAQYLASIVDMQLQGTIALSNSQPAFPGLQPYSFLAYIFLPLIPMAILGFRRIRSPLFRYWLVICIAGFVTSTSSSLISTQLVSPDRWALMITIPLCAYATRGLSTWNWRSAASFRLPYFVFPSWLMIVLMMGAAFLVLPASLALPYYRYYSPTSMEQSTIPVEYSPYVVRAIMWLSSNIESGQVFMTVNAMYGWAREYFHANNTVVWFYSGTSLEAALLSTIQQGYSHVYTIWWDNNEGWYGDPSVPPGFVLQHQEGPMGVFLYVA